MTMLTAITAMIIGMKNAGVAVSTVEMTVFPLFNIVAIFCLIVLLRNINEKNYNGNQRNYSA
jgi:chromate transport protein ChrA